MLYQNKIYHSCVINVGKIRKIPKGIILTKSVILEYVNIVMKLFRKINEIK